MEYIQSIVPIDKAWPGIRNNNAAQQDLLSRMELEIREGIARELEVLVQSNAEPHWHGMPEGAGVETSRALPPSLFYPAQQDFFRAAANVVRGKVKATDDDWDQQAARMGRHDLMLDGLQGMFQMPDEKDDPAAAAKHERTMERIREWNE